jgi:transcription elongation factor GreA
LRSSNEIPEKKITSWVALKFANYANIKNEVIDISEFFKVKNLAEFYSKLDLELKKTFLEIVRNNLKDWDIKFADFILNSPLTRIHRFMIDELEAAGKNEVLESIYISCMNSFQDKPDLYVWFSKIILEENSKLMENLGIRESEIIIRFISLIDILNEEIEKKNNIGRNKRVLENIEDLLFKKNRLKYLLENSDEVTVKSILMMIESSVSFDSEEKQKLLNLIYSKYPALKKPETNKGILAIRHPFLVTRASYEAKKKELEHIINVEIPENSKAIGEAMEKGDLRENAEYKAALERQDQLKATVAKLESELAQAKIINREEVNTSFVDVGTKVTLESEDGQKISYEILGQWDVDIAKNRISYHSPLGKVFLDKKIGDKVVLEISGRKNEWKIVSIELADFE